MFNFGIIGFQDVFVAMHSGKYVTAIIHQSFTQNKRFPQLLIRVTHLIDG